MRLLINHLPEYLIEAALLGGFMISACAFTILLEHPALSLRSAIPDPFVRRVLIGLAMGATAISLIYSPLGRRSGAHMNPAITLTYLWLGKIDPRDAAAYVAAQFLGGIAGILIVGLIAGMLAGDPAVRFAATIPGSYGDAIALIAEVTISFVTMSVVLNCSNRARLAPYTGLLCGLLVASYVIFESPISGFSQNPARSFASAFGARQFTALWIYFTAPLLGMFAAAALYTRIRGLRQVRCAKLNHAPGPRCIFRCDFGQLREAGE
jgi:aquaporin Z